jgi:hypothetical protein
MQQRQLRLGDILDDYCPRERRVTNHAVVAMVGDDVKQTRCTTCDAEHEYKHARVPRQRRKPESPAAVLAQAAAAPKRVPHEHETAPASLEAEASDQSMEMATVNEAADASEESPALVAQESTSRDTDEIPDGDSSVGEQEQQTEEEGPVHRPLIRATLPRVGGQPPAPRPAPEFTIRQPGGRQNRFRRQGGGGGQQFFGNRSNGNQGGGGRQHGGWNSRQQDGQRSRRSGQGHKRSK